MRTNDRFTEFFGWLWCAAMAWRGLQLALEGHWEGYAGMILFTGMLAYVAYEDIQHIRSRG